MKRALIIAEDSSHAQQLADHLEEHDLAGEILIQADPTSDIAAHESLHRLASLGTLAAGAAHEVNNLLTYVSVTMDRLSAPPLQPAGDDVQQMIGTAVDCCGRMQAILRGITSFARDRGVSQAPLLLGQVVDQALALVRDDISTTAELLVSHQPDLPHMVGNAGQLTQVVINLLLNSLHAVSSSSAEAAITVRTFRHEKDGHIAVSVEDNGHGIPEGSLERVFEAFYTTKPDGAGTGLGLYLARSIARRHGGDIVIRSNVGEGTSVEVKLPTTREATTEPATIGA